MPTVLVAHPAADVYGSDRQLVETLAGLRARGWRVRLHLPESGPLLDVLAERGLGEVDVRIGAFPVLRKAVLRPVALLRQLARLPVDLVRTVREIRRAGAHVVYVSTVTIPLWGLAARLCRVPVVVHVHEAEELLPRPVRTLLYAPVRLAQTVIANSATTRRVLVAAQPRLARRVVVVPNGVPDLGAQPADAIEPGRVVVVGRLSPRKGVDVALEAVALLRAEGREVRLELCGTTFAGYEWYERQLRERAARPDLAGAVHFAGYVATSWAALRAAQLVVAPSLGESFGNAAVEGLLAARPVIASDVQALAEVIDDGRTGLLVPPGDAAALARTIARVLDEPDLAARLAAAGRADALTRFAVGRYHAGVADAVAAASPTSAGIARSEAGSRHSRDLFGFGSLGRLVSIDRTWRGGAPSVHGGNTGDRLCGATRAARARTRARS